jgi:hypothetical protein
MPNTGPNDGSRSTTLACLPILFNACDNPMETVVLPSSAGVGEMADTNISFGSLNLGGADLYDSGTFALNFP